MTKGLCILSLRYLNIYVHCSLHSGDELDPTQTPINRQTDNDSVLRTTKAIHLAVKGEMWQLWIGLEIIPLNKVTQIQKEKHLFFCTQLCV